MMERWGVPVVSAGDVLRSAIAAGTPLGQEAARYMNDGGLVPDRVAIASVEGWLDAHSDFVFDGFPRTVGQAEALEGILAQRSAPLTAVLWLELAVSLIEQRVSLRLVCADCGRSFQVGSHVARRDDVCPVCGGKLNTRHDDDPEKLATRMIAYDKSTAPLMDYYEQRGLLHRIDAAQPAEQVFARIEAATRAEAGAATVIP